MSQPFDPPLSVDPAVALPAVSVPGIIAGPAHRAQFVIEIVGPRSVTAQAARRLVDPDWFAALGKPDVFAMRASDTEWQRLTGSQDGSYDSLALAWDFFDPSGAVLTGQAADHLFRAAEQFAQAVQRRAMPIPPPPDLPKLIKIAEQARAELDIGIAVGVIPRSGSIDEESLWRVCARLGLTFTGSGSFVWQVPTHPEPLLEVTPIGNTDRFSLAAVHKRVVHTGATVGFSIPRCPEPIQATLGLLHVAQTLALAVDGTIFDDENRVVTEPRGRWIQGMVERAAQMLDQAGFPPGSAAALKLF